MNLTEDAKYLAAAQELSTRMLLRDAALILPVTISIALFGVAFSTTPGNMKHILLAIPFLSFFSSKVFRYHDGNIGKLSLFMASLENKSENLSTDCWHSKKGGGQSLAHNLGTKTFRIAQHSIFAGIPFLAILLWVSDIKDWSRNINFVLVGITIVVAVLSIIESFRAHRERSVQSNKKNLKMNDYKKYLHNKCINADSLNIAGYAHVVTLCKLYFFRCPA
ncbi:hypothetical protein [Desulforegula conservatrix]|uniref:hypothetical protein n=1 Tax=Desulforegula conservatrix TaxID=153026 RepID=UPI0004059B61|nr:hypothetical protein [Desulforegula conservatrix]